MAFLGSVVARFISRSNPSIKLTLNEAEDVDFACASRRTVSTCSMASGRVAAFIFSKASLTYSVTASTSAPNSLNFETRPIRPATSFRKCQAITPTTIGHDIAFSISAIALRMATQAETVSRLGRRAFCQRAVKFDRNTCD